MYLLRLPRALSTGYFESFSREFRLDGRLEVYSSLVGQKQCIDDHVGQLALKIRVTGLHICRQRRIGAPLEELKQLARFNARSK